MYIQQEILNEVTSKLNNQLENLVIDGLKLKGFEFTNKIDLEKFIKTRCKRFDNIMNKEHIYYVDEIPFFLHKYEVIYEPINYNDNEVKMTANWGSYSFL